MQLTSIDVDGRKVTLVEGEIKSDHNITTILIGKNGCGKSRLFQSICSAFIRKFQPKSPYDFDLRDVENLLDDFERIVYKIKGDEFLISNQFEPISKIYRIDGLGDIIYVSNPPYQHSDIKVYPRLLANGKNIHEDYSFTRELFINHLEDVRNRKVFYKNNQSVEDVPLPNKILAVTSSPYDKYPFSNSYHRSTINAPYIYLGSRTKRSAGARFNRGYMSYKFDQLGASFVKLLLKPKQEHVDFTIVFDALNLSSEFELKFSLDERVHQEQLSEDKILPMLRGVSFMKDRTPKYENFSQAEQDDLSKRLLNAINEVFSEGMLDNVRHFDPVTVTCNVDFRNQQNETSYLKSLALLAEFDLIDLEDVRFTKSSSKQSFLLSQASSGELSFLFTMSSIAGDIENDSLILIDEPELSLNPEWQLNFLPLLSRVFSNYKDCHFIIATHSPNIVSAISENNSFIVDLDTHKTSIYSSENYYNRSSDYQLAMLFKSPGFKNEFLISESIDILNKLSQPLSESDEKIKELKDRASLMFDIRMYLSEDDPVKRLIDMIERALGVIQRD